MNAVARTHRRLAVLMGASGLLAFAGGAGLPPLTAVLAGGALATALFWHPAPVLSSRLEKVWGPLAILLVIRAAVHILTGGGDVVVPVVDLLLLLLAAESLRSLDAANDVRIYALAFALLLAATAYRPGLAFAVGFLGFVVLGALAVPLGLLRRKAARYGVPDPGLDRAFVRVGVRIAGATLAGAGLVFLAFPRISEGWAGRGETLATSVAGFADDISLGEHGSRIYPNPEIVLRVEFPEGLPDDFLGLHWRGRSYDRFDGVRWTRSEGIRPSSAPVEWYRERWDGDLLTQRIYGAPLDVRVLFAVHPLVAVEAESRIQPMFDNVGDFSYWGSGPPVYTARSVASPPSPELLRRANAGFMPDRTRYLQLPRLPDRIGALADSLTRDAGTRYDKVVAVERWLRTFEYTRELPRTAGEATLDHFLFQRRAGHCEYFSTAMVVLLRSAGIHARNVNGFLGGRWNDFGGYLAVTQNEAHSWVEVWFPGYGWVPFDPTPGGSVDDVEESEWFWGGRVLWDALQHRWSKWVLDYSLLDQVGLLDRAGAWLRDRNAPEAGADAPAPGSRPWTWIVAGLVLAGGALGLRTLGRRSGRPRRTPESRAYLALVRATRRAGVGGGPATGPLALLDRIRRDAPEAAADAARLVDLYLRARFGGRPLDADQRRALRAALAGARRALGS